MVMAAPAIVLAQPAPQTPEIVSRMEQVEHSGRVPRPWTVLRSYRLFNAEQQNPAAEVMARVEYVPPQTKTFEIVQASGNGRAAGIVKHILENEAQMSRTPEVSE